MSEISRVADEAADTLQRELAALASVVDYAELAENMRVIMGMRAAIATLQNLATQLN